MYTCSLCLRGVCVYAFRLIVYWEWWSWCFVRCMSVYFPSCALYMCTYTMYFVVNPCKLTLALTHARMHAHRCTCSCMHAHKHKLYAHTQAHTWAHAHTRIHSWHTHVPTCTYIYKLKCVPSNKTSTVFRFGPIPRHATLSPPATPLLLGRHASLSGTTSIAFLEPVLTLLGTTG